MLIEQIPSFLRAACKGVTWRRNSKEKIIYLTFDDGPIPEVTPWVLDVLDQYQVKATFFCVGENVFKHPDVYQEVLRRGHRTGNHTYNHIRGLFTKTEAYMANIGKAAQLIDSPLFRPPHGDMRLSQLKLLREKYEIIQWDVITRDYDKDISKERVLKIVQRYARNGSIIVFHDSLKAEQNMRYAMPKAIEFLLKEGYQFKTLY